VKFKYRPAHERGSAEHGWLHARFTFSFANYYDPEHNGFHSLQVMNNDVIEPGGGFPTHPHQDAEIFTYVLSGRLEHEDSMGNGSIIEAGDLQYMSAGDGVRHSEFNPSDSEPTELYQIWMRPNQRGGMPRYAEKKLSAEKFYDKNKLLFSEDGRDGSVAIRQNAEVYMARLQAGDNFNWKQNTSFPNLWIQMIEGETEVNGRYLEKADGLGIENFNKELFFSAVSKSKFFIFCLIDEI
jgi:redox-sensitive bicupin YhaK (pirin superfamily)